MAETSCFTCGLMQQIFLGGTARQDGTCRMLSSMREHAHKIERAYLLSRRSGSSCSMSMEELTASAMRWAA